MSRAILVVCVAVFMSLIVLKSQSTPPLVQVGQTYVFVLQCDAYSGCYGEIHKVVQIRPDGWLDTMQCGDPDCQKAERWQVNLSRVVAIKPATPGRAAD